jgi:hypothetical protein
MGTTPPPPTGSGCLKGATGDYSQPGPYGIGRMDVEIPPQGMYTLFYPAPFDDNCRHPIVAWGNGTAVVGSDVYAFYQEHAASYGIVVAASHDPNTGSGAFHTVALDYLLAENENPSSMFYQRLSPIAGVSGHSQGGGGADIGARHPNVVAEVNVQGAFGRAPAGVAFLCLTGTADIATQGCDSATASATQPALFANWQGGDHFLTSTLGGFIVGDPGALQYRRLYSLWFRCFLDDDSNACGYLSPCQVCNDPGWAQIRIHNY